MKQLTREFFQKQGRLGRRRANLSQEQLRAAGRKGAVSRWKNHKKGKPKRRNIENKILRRA